MKNQTNKPIQFVLQLTIVFSALIFTTGCNMNKSERGINLPINSQNTRGTRTPTNPNSPNASQEEWIQVDWAYQGLDMERVVMDFLDTDDLQNLWSIGISIQNGTLSINIEDDLGWINLDLRSINGESNTYGDDQGSVTFIEMESLGNDLYLFRMDFENANGVANTLGYVELYGCEIAGTC